MRWRLAHDYGMSFLKALSIEEAQKNLLTTITHKMTEWYNLVRDIVAGLIEGLTG